MLKIAQQIYWFIQSLLGWSKTPQGDLVIRLPAADEQEISFENWFPTENILAYTLRNDDSIYIAEGQEKTVAMELNAEIDGDIWRFQEKGKTVSRKKQIADLSLSDYMLSHVVTTLLQDWKCIRIQAGTWLSFYSRKKAWGGWKYTLIMQFKTNEDGNWCRMARRQRCQTVWGTYTGEYRRRRRGRWVTTRETHRLSSCTN